MSSRQFSAINESGDEIPPPSSNRRRTRASQNESSEDSLRETDSGSPIRKRARGRTLTSPSESSHSFNDIHPDLEAPVRRSEVEEAVHRSHSRALPLEPAEDTPSFAHLPEFGGGLREMSEDEMNALRAKLKLKPLDPQPATSKTTESKLDISTDNLSTLERLRIAKERRLEREKAKARRNSEQQSFATLGDSSDEDESTAAWVQKHSQLLEEKKRAEIQAKRLEEVDEEQQLVSIESFEGMKVTHDIDQLDEDTVLVIKDANVLDAGYNDELESTEIVSIEKGKMYQEKMKKKSHYDLYDEDGKPKALLAQYDEEEQEKLEKARKGFFLTSRGPLLPKDSKTGISGDSVPSNMVLTDANAAEEDAIFSDTFKFGSRPTLSDDFETSTGDSDVTFGKKSQSSEGRKKKMIRKRRVEEETLGTGSALDALVPDTQYGLVSRSERERLAAAEEDRVMAQRQRNYAKYQKALQTASERSQSVFKSDSTAMETEIQSRFVTRPLVPPPLRTRPEDIVARTREFAKRRQQLEEEAKREAEAGTEIMYSTLSDFNMPILNGGDVEVKHEADSDGSYSRIRDVASLEHQHGEAAMEIDESEREASLNLHRADTVVEKRMSAPQNSSSTSDWPVRVKKEHEGEDNGAIETANTGSAVSQEDETSLVREQAEKLRKARTGRRQVGLTQAEEESSEMPQFTPDADADVKTEAEEGKYFIPSQPEGSKPRSHHGMASILAIVQQRGGLDEDPQQLFAGREKDRRMQELVAGGGVSSNRGSGVPEYYREIEIERRDKWGRPQTAKEAFKEFSAAFSGRHSGKRKQEKKYEKYKQQVSTAKHMTESALSQSLQSIQTAQKKSAAPFVVLNSQTALSSAKSGLHDVELGDHLKQPKPK